MTVPSKLKLSGATVIGPIQPSGNFPSGQSVYQLNFEETVNGSFCTTRSISSPSPGFVDLLSGSGLTDVRYVYLRARVGSFVVRLTTPNGGVDQEFDLSRLLVISNPQPGTEITALSIQGVGDIEVQLAGDP